MIKDCFSVRNHVVHVSESGLVTIAGGKWTTYRAMAMETVDAALDVAGVEKVRKEKLLINEKIENDWFMIKDGS